MSTTGSGPSGGTYSRVAILLHWAIALLIVFNLAVGFFMEGLGPDWRRTVVTAHLSSGITVLALTFVRIAWRLAHRPPPRADPLRRWEKVLARAVHVLLYAMMLVMPLSGWVIISANPPAGSPGAEAQQRRFDAATRRGEPADPPRVSGRSRFWYVLPLPSLPFVAAIGARPDGLTRQHEIHEDAADIHRRLAFVAIALILLHVCGALKHQFVDGHAELARMGVGARRLRAADRPS